MNKFKFPVFISISDCASALRALFPSWPLAAHDTCVHMHTPSSGGSNGALYLLHHPTHLSRIISVSSLKGTSFTKTENFSHFGCSSLLSCYLLGHQFCLLHVSFKSFPSFLLQLLARVSPWCCWSCDNRPSTRTTRNSAILGAQCWPLLSPVCTLSNGGRKLQVTSALGRDVHTSEAMLTSPPTPLYSQQALGRQRRGGVTSVDLGLTSKNSFTYLPHPDLFATSLSILFCFGFFSFIF